jgi:hypothetical protein
VGHLDALQRLRVRSLLPEAPLFLRGDAPWPSWALHIEWRRVLTAGYRAPEQLRHTFASTMLSRNAPLLYVQKQGGWRSAAVLLRVYSRWLPPDVEAVSAPPSGTPAQPAAASAAHNARNSRRKGRNFQKHLAPTRARNSGTLQDSGPKSIPRQDNHAQPRSAYVAACATPPQAFVDAGPAGRIPAARR